MSSTYDYSKLLGRLREKGLTQAEAAKALGISESSLNLTLNSKRPFRQSEILGLCDLLSLSSENIGSYFFSRRL